MIYSHYILKGTGGINYMSEIETSHMVVVNEMFYKREFQNPVNIDDYLREHRVAFPRWACGKNGGMAYMFFSTGGNVYVRKFLKKSDVGRDIEWPQVTMKIPLEKVTTTDGFFHYAFGLPEDLTQESYLNSDERIEELLDNRSAAIPEKVDLRFSSMVARTIAGMLKTANSESYNYRAKNGKVAVRLDSDTSQDYTDLAKQLLLLIPEHLRFRLNFLVMPNVNGHEDNIFGIDKSEYSPRLFNIVIFTGKYTGLIPSEYAQVIEEQKIEDEYAWLERWTSLSEKQRTQVYNLSYKKYLTINRSETIPEIFEAIRPVFEIYEMIQQLPNDKKERLLSILKSLFDYHLNREEGAMPLLKKRDNCRSTSGSLSSEINKLDSRLSSFISSMEKVSQITNLDGQFNLELTDSTGNVSVVPADNTVRTMLEELGLLEIVALRQKYKPLSKFERLFNSSRNKRLEEMINDLNSKLPDYINTFKENVQRELAKKKGEKAIADEKLSAVNNRINDYKSEHPYLPSEYISGICNCVPQDNELGQLILSSIGEMLNFDPSNYIKSSQEQVKEPNQLPEKAL